MLRALPAAVVVLLALLVLPASAAAAAEVERGSAAYRRCMKAADLVEPVINQCMFDERARQDRVMAGLYRRLLAGVAADRRAPLRAAQRAWLAFRDRQCGFEYDRYAPHPEARASAGACNMTMAWERTGDLRRLLKGTPRPAGDAAEAARQERALEAAWRRTRAGTEEVTTDLPPELSAKPPHPRAALDAAQRAWRLYRDRQCGFERDGVGCRIALTRERVEMLGR